MSAQHKNLEEATNLEEDIMQMKINNAFDESLTV